MAATSSPPGLGLLKGLAVTVKHMLKPAVTQQYPHVKPDLAPRTRGVIALMEENCTVCMLCSRECPDWCIYIDSHKETVPPAKEGGRARTRNMLDRFAIDFALCMYCGICVEVCPFDALFWSPEFEYSEYDMGALLHEKDKLREWMDTVPPPPPLDEGADAPAEVADAIEKRNKELEAAAAKAAEQARAAEQGDAGGDQAAAGGGGAAKAEEPKVEAGEIDQETFDRLIAEGKSERIARSKAKAAFVKKEKARLKAEQEQQAAQADAGGGAPAAEEPKVEAGEIDQETFDRLIAEGKSERMARAKAKAAFVKKEKARLREQQAAEGGGDAGAEAPAGGEAEAGQSPSGEAAETPAEAPAPKKGDIQVEGAGEIDQETYDQLIAEGKSERIARSKAKAAWVRKKKQEQIDGGGDQ